MPCPTGQLFQDLPPAGAEELFTPLFANPALRIERIVSDGQADPPGFWCQQPEDEWVVLLQGGACLGFADGSRLTLAPGAGSRCPRAPGTASNPPSRARSGWRSTEGACPPAEALPAGKHAAALIHHAVVQAIGLDEEPEAARGAGRRTPSRYNRPARFACIPQRHEDKDMNPSIDPTQLDWHMLQAYAIPWGLKVLLALLVLVIGLWLAKLITSLAGKALTKARMDEMLVRFLESLLKALLQVVVVIAALGQLGVQTTSLIAVLGAAGLAIGLALQNSLANFAAGVMLLVFKPFKAGDFVEAGGVQGVVEHIRVFNSVLRTLDNREITVPNGNIYTGVITNYSARDTRRVDLVVGISYDSDIRKAKELVQSILAADARVLKDPEPSWGVADLADSSVNLFIRPWVASADYWAVRADVLEAIKLGFDANGIGIPCPQMDVHLQQAQA